MPLGVKWGGNGTACPRPPSRHPLPSVGYHAAPVNGAPLETRGPAFPRSRPSRSLPPRSSGFLVSPIWRWAPVLPVDSHA